MLNGFSAVRAWLALGVAGLGLAGGLAGCGSGASKGDSAAASPHTTTLPSGQLIVEAAARTDRAPGYRLAATFAVSVGQTRLTGAMTGTAERHGHRVALSLRETVAGRMIDLQLRSDGQTYYMSGIPGLSRLSHGRRWLRFDIGAAERAGGLGGLQTSASSDPTQYLAYLRAVGGHPQRVGTTTVRGVATTQYRATIDLDRYVTRAPTADRAAARRSVAVLESALGAHSLPVDVWIDGRGELRRMQMGVPLCAAGHRLSMSLTMDLFDYGQVPAVTIPSASDSYDVTPRLTSTLARSQAAARAAASGCSGTS